MPAIHLPSMFIDKLEAYYDKLSEGHPVEIKLQTVIELAFEKGIDNVTIEDVLLRESTPATQEFWGEVKKLTEGVDVDLDKPLDIH